MGNKFKQIHIYYINKIKECDARIFEAQDTDPGFVNTKVVKANERAMEHWLDKAGVIEPELRREILLNAQFTNNDSCSVLEKLGWTILKGKENLNL